MTLNRWDIWLANVKFEDSDEVRCRPVLVIEELKTIVITLKMTKHAPRPEFKNEYAVIDWEGCGLKMPTTIRGGKTLSLPQSAFIRKIGTLQGIDIINVGLFL